MKITKVSQSGVDLIKEFEGLSLKPYLCSAHVPTIGYGSTRYPNNTKVSLKDKPITKEQAEDMLRFDLSAFEKQVDAMCRDDISQRQFDALVSFCYNVGPSNLKNSTLLKKVNQNPNDISIKAEFAKWSYAGGHIIDGLKRRREMESNLYFNL